MGGMLDVVRAIQGTDTKPDASSISAAPSDVPEFKPLSAYATIESALHHRLTYLALQHRSEAAFEGYGLNGLVFSPSLICYPFCTRQATLERVAEKRLKPPVSADLQGIFMLGHAAHRMVQEEILGPLGILYGFWYTSTDSNGNPIDLVEGFQPTPHHRYKEVRCLDVENYIGGHTDGLLYVNNEWVLLDIKTINRFKFQTLQEPIDVHVTQVQLYGRCVYNTKKITPQPKRGCIMYLCKDTSHIKYFWFDLDARATQHVLNRISAVSSALRAKKLPQRDTRCTDRHAENAQKCGACDLCFAVDDGAQAYKNLVALLTKGTP